MDCLNSSQSKSLINFPTWEDTTWGSPGFAYFCYVKTDKTVCMETIQKALQSRMDEAPVREGVNKRNGICLEKGFFRKWLKKKNGQKLDPQKG
jgi:hypothetical protein